MCWDPVTRLTIAPQADPYYGERMRIYLLRHGRAESGLGMADAERSLSRGGEQGLAAAAPAWRRLAPQLDVVGSSPLRRAQQTADLLCAATGGEPERRTQSGLTPSSDPQLALELIGAEMHSGTQHLALVGHQPHLGELLGLLLHGERHRPIPFEPGMLVAVELRRSTSLLGELRFALTQDDAARLR